MIDIHSVTMTFSTKENQFVRNDRTAEEMGYPFISKIYIDGYVWSHFLEFGMVVSPYSMDMVACVVFIV